MESIRRSDLGDQAQWTVSDATDGDDLVGIKVNSGDIRIPEHDGERTLVRLGVRVTEDSGGNSLEGPWTIGGNVTINKKPAPLQ